MKIELKELIIRPRLSKTDGIRPGYSVDWGKDRPVLVQVCCTPIKEIQVHPGHKTWSGQGQPFRFEPTSIALRIEGKSFLDFEGEVFETSQQHPLSKKLLSELSPEICGRLGIPYFDVGAHYRKGFTICLLPTKQDTMNDGQGLPQGQA